MPRPQATLFGWKDVARQKEHDLQIDCTRMLEPALLPTVVWTAVDHAHSLNMQIGRNGKPIGFAEAARRKARGVKAGIPDYLFWHAGDFFAIEMKRSADDQLRDDQKTFLRGLLAAGGRVKVCWTIDQVFRTTGEWGLLRANVRLVAA